jgi:hypothetical protein
MLIMQLILVAVQWMSFPHQEHYPIPTQDSIAGAYGRSMSEWFAPRSALCGGMGGGRGRWGGGVKSTERAPHCASWEQTSPAGMELWPHRAWQANVSGGRAGCLRSVRDVARTPAAPAQWRNRTGAREQAGGYAGAGGRRRADAGRAGARAQARGRAGTLAQAGAGGRRRAQAVGRAGAREAQAGGAR